MTGKAVGPEEVEGWLILHSRRKSYYVLYSCTQLRPSLYPSKTLESLYKVFKSIYPIQSPSPSPQKRTAYLTASQAFPSSADVLI